MRKTLVKEPDSVLNRRGGARPGSGRKPLDTVLIHVSVPRSIYVRILSEARRLRVGSCPNGSQVRIGDVISARFSDVVVEDSPAVRLARECGLLPPV